MPRSKGVGALSGRNDARCTAGACVSCTLTQKSAR